MGCDHAGCQLDPGAGGTTCQRDRGGVDSGRPICDAIDRADALFVATTAPFCATEF